MNRDDSDAPGRAAPTVDLPPRDGAGPESFDSGVAWDVAPSGAGFGAAASGGRAPGRPAGRAPTQGGDEGGDEGGDVGHPFDLPAADRYEDQCEAGRGGMGRVMVSEDRRLQRQVARKEVAVPDGEAARRLAQEAWITAQLDHPGIVPVFDAGRTEDGRLFYTMRLIRGRALHEVLAQAPGLDERLALLRHYLDACEAIAYAHSQGVLHRDIKPANIMVGEFGETQVMDWGLARTLDDLQGRAMRRTADLSRHAPRTVTGAVVGTPAYMSPEQAAGDPVDCRSDVWSLGVVLYELLAGHPPFEGNSSRQILSRVLRGATPALPADAPPELAAIAEQALRADPAERYPDARALAADVGAFLDGRRVGAFDYRPVDLARRLLRAWRAPLLVAAGALVMLGGVGLAAWEGTRAERDRALAAERAAEQAQAAGERHLGGALLGQARAAARAEARAEAEVLAANALLLRESPEARGVLAAFAVEPRPRLVETIGLPSCRARQVDATARYLACLRTDSVELWDLSTGQVAWTRPVVADTITVLPDGRVFLVADGSRIVLGPDGALQDEIADAAGLSRLAAGGQDDTVVGFSHGGWRAFGAADAARHSAYDHARDRREDDKLYTAAVSSVDRVARLWNDGRLEVGPADGTAPILVDIGAIFSQADATSVMAFSPSGRLLGLGSLDGQAIVVEPDTGRSWGPIEPGIGPLRSISIDPSEARVAITSEWGVTRVWELDGGGLLPRMPADEDGLARFIAKDELVIVGRSLRRWKLDGVGRSHVWEASGGVTSVRATTEGSVVAAATPGRVLIWDLETGRRRSMLGLDSSDVIKAVAVVPDRPILFGPPAYSIPGFSVDLRSGELTVRGGIEHYWRRAEGLAGGHVVGIGYGSGPFLVDVDAWEQRADLALPGLRFNDLGAQRDGAVAVTNDTDGGIWLIHPEPPRMERVAEDPEAIAVDVARDGERIVLGEREGVRVIDRATGVERTWILPSQRVMEVAISDDGRLAAAGLLSGEVLIWSIDGDRQLALLRGHTERVVSLDFTPDGAHLLSGSWDDSVRIWGLDVIEMTPEQLVREVESAWGLDLDEALAVDLRSSN